MLLTISTTYRPATDLGYLLHKHPARSQVFPTAFGKAHVFFPEAEEKRCTAVLLLDVDPIGLIRGRRRGHAGYALQQYVNDRPYVASSLLSVAIAKVYGTALAGKCKDRPDLVNTPIPLESTLAVVPDPSGGELLERLFRPLGYSLELERFPLDPEFPDWGDSNYFTVRLQGELCLSKLLSHLYVLVPVLDNHKHYWVGDAEVEKLLRRGEGWLADHPEKELIAKRYLKYKRSLTQAALERLLADETIDLAADEDSQVEEETDLERPLSLNEQRLNQVLGVLKTRGISRVLDLGCGEGRLLRLLLREKQFTQIVGLDVSHRALENAKRRLHLDRLSEKSRERIQLLHASLTYKDARLEGFDAAAVVEVIEHLDLARLAAFERVLFEHARPSTIVLTTPNAEYNVKFDSLPEGALRHKDHRFEWTRREFQEWANGVAERFGYAVRFLPVGTEDEIVGAPSQMGVFTR
ncbi:MAG: 3' terminal RNA ribose 2'-O-methyltransferase Hen1 [Anaerolineales bacterium]